MQLKVTPKIDARYWAAFSIASMCGTNSGDFFPDILHLGSGMAIAILAVLFGVIVMIDRGSRRGSEASYWLMILVVRAAATQIADFTIGQAHLGYLFVSAALTVLLVALIAVRHRIRRSESTTSTLPLTDGWYWWTMLTAGALGTVIGDGIGHSFGPASTGVPLSAMMATVALALVLIVRSRLALVYPSSYWVAVVAVRWWGTNTGDILAFLASLTVSLIVTGAILALVLLRWRQQPTEHVDQARSLSI